MRYEGKTRLPTVSDTAILGFFGEYKFLSNYCYTPVHLDGFVYPTSEHAFMAEKTDDLGIRDFISKIKTPSDARYFGQTIVLIPNWDVLRIPAMARVLKAKFEIDAVRIPLLNTGKKYLEETNDWQDTFWGCCDGYGGNHLGNLIMKERKAIQDSLS
jgi:ribA/ribD-fused uncharacterized protein